MGGELDNGGAIGFVISGHAYTTTLIPAMPDGIGILSRLISLLGEPLVDLIGNVVADPAKLAIVIKAATDRNDDTKIDALLGGVSLAGIGKGLRAGLSEVDAAPLINDILHWTHRDGLPLRDPATFNAAYRGNYTELMRAVFEVIKINGLFPQPGI